MIITDVTDQRMDSMNNMHDGKEIIINTFYNDSHTEQTPRYKTHDLSTVKYTKYI
jgi:hypothetical protein